MRSHSRSTTEPGGRALHPTGGQAPVHLAPQDRRDLVAVEAVEDPAGLGRVDEALVDGAGVGHRPLDGGAR